MNEWWMSEKVVYKTAPATPSPLNIKKACLVKKIQNFMSGRQGLCVSMMSKNIKKSKIQKKTKKHQILFWSYLWHFPGTNTFIYLFIDFLTPKCIWIYMLANSWKLFSSICSKAFSNICFSMFYKHCKSGSNLFI